MIDYLGCYTKVLKYDAVPTLFLPHPVIIKTSFDENIQIEDEGTEIKDIIVYNVTNDNTTFQTESANHDNTEGNLNDSSNNVDSLKLDPNTSRYKSEEDEEENVNRNVSDEIVLSSLAKERFNDVNTYRDYLDLLDENERYRKEAVQLESRINNLQNTLKKKIESFHNCDKEYRKQFTKYHSIKNKSKSYDDQLKILLKVFSESQIKILTGKKKIYWSNDDMAMGYTIRHMSNKRCYIYLSKTLNFPLPALSSIKRWVTLKKSEFAKMRKKVKDSSKDDDEEEEEESD